MLYRAGEYLYVIACGMPFINTAYTGYVRELIVREGMSALPGTETANRSFSTATIKRIRNRRNRKGG
ncbi:MAG: hypothetical protein LBP74_08170 [Treponema sp.]|nr:hypothetical protein [Treponema sp.]